MDVYSYDFWDTLVGRRYYSPRSVFEQIYKELPLQDFVERRVWSEHHTPLNTLSGIYNFYRDHFKEDQRKLDVLLRKEYGYEFETSFPIYDVIAQLKTPYILVSDFYMDKLFFKAVLERNSIHLPIDYFVGWDGKSTGRVWNEIKKHYTIIEHWGDNPSSDVTLARANGVNGLLYTGSKFTETEDYLRAAGFNNLACLLRMLRLSNPHKNDTIAKDLWNDEVLNVGVMILFSQIIHKTAEGRQILFTYRDCNLLIKMYGLLFPEDKMTGFHTSRDLYLHPTAEFTEYTRFCSVDNSLIVDLQGTGESCYAFFNSIDRNPNYLTLIDSDRQRRNFPNKYHVVRWDDGYSDRIERLNYSTVGKLLNINLPFTVRADPNLDSLPYINTQQDCFKKGMEFIEEGFDLNLSTDYKSGIVILLRKIEKGLRIEGVVRHDET